MKIRPDTALTFDDVLLVPQHSSIRSRSAVTTATCLTPGLCMQIPIISANMDTVTEHAMAIAMAQEGGIGILHRFMTIDLQAASVERVKRAESFVVERPHTISPEDLDIWHLTDDIEEALELVRQAWQQDQED